MNDNAAGQGPIGRPVRSAVAYCPFCGSDAVTHVKTVPRCTACRAVFFVDFSRHTPSARTAQVAATQVRAQTEDAKRCG